MILKELISDFLDSTYDTDLGSMASTRTLSVKSITKSSKDLTMIFPVMVSNTVDGTSAQLIARALERKFVTLCQILLTAISITKSTDAIDHLKNIHSNIDQGSIFDIDDYINMNVMDETVLISQAEKQRVCEDYRLNFFSMNNILQSFNEGKKKKEKKNKGGGQSQDNSNSEYEAIIARLMDQSKNKLYDDPTGSHHISNNNRGGQQQNSNSGSSSASRNNGGSGNHKNNNSSGNHKNSNSSSSSAGNNNSSDHQQNSNRGGGISAEDLVNDKIAWGMPREEFDKLSPEDKNNVRNAYMDELGMAVQGSVSLKKLKKEYEQALKHEIEKSNQEFKHKLKKDEEEFESQLEKERLAKERSKGIRLNRIYKDKKGNYLTAQTSKIEQQDIKKSNELQPSVLKISYISRVKDDHIRNEALVGIKSKMYLVDSRDIIDKIIAKRTYSLSLYNLIKATTGEIQFWRDFVFAIKKAKIDALSNSNRGSSHSMWKVLERRAVASKLNRFASMRNDATAITTLVMSKYDAEMLKKEEDINILDARIARKIMDDYNLIGIVVDDASTESARFIFDTGDDEYEVYTYRTLKKEDKVDYKQMIELMAGR